MDLRLPVRPTLLCLALVLLAGCAPEPAEFPGDDTAGAEAQPSAEPERGPRVQPETEMGIYTPEQHNAYDGRWVVTGSDIHQAGTLSDESPWDHMDDDASDLRTVGGTAEIDVNEIENTGTFRAELDLPEGEYIIEVEELREFSPCQDGGVAAFIFEHGNSGCGDSNWPKSLLWVAGWGIGFATLNGEPLYEDYQIHFMVTQGMRDRETLAVRPFPVETPGAGAVNPAAFQLDFYIRSPEENPDNHPSREVFDHFFAMNVTFR